jgi:hypothetical protein
VLCIRAAPLSLGPVRQTWRSAPDLAVRLVLVAAGLGLWILHATSWGLGGRSPVLNYDTAQYALAARELAGHARLATTFALPIELARHAAPPWPLAVVQPGLMVAEALLFRLVPVAPERLTLVLPFFCYLMLGITLATTAGRLIEARAPGIAPGRARLAALTIGLGLLLDPEAQHFAVGGFTELPFALGLAAAFAVLLGEHGAARRPLLFGLLLGVAGSFRASGLWLAPLLALAAAAIAPGRRVRVAALALTGYALVLAPWWLYKWREFGTPGWDLSSLIVWEGIQGRTWFSIFHLPEMPPLPHGTEALGLVAAKIVRRLPGLALALASGPRVLWAGALVLWLLAARPPRALSVVAIALLIANGMSLLAAAATIPWIPFLFPTRVLMEAAGVMSLWALIARAPESLIGERLKPALAVAVAALAIGWGVNQTLVGNHEAWATSRERGVPSDVTLRALAARVNQQVPAGEPVMSNLGPTLAWAAERPVVHLAQTPADVAACRHRLAFRYVLIAFRDAGSAWPGWQEVLDRPEEAARHPEWNVTHERHWQEPDGFRIVWLELGPLEPNLAAAGAAAGATAAR